MHRACPIPFALALPIVLAIALAATAYATTAITVDDQAITGQLVALDATPAVTLRAEGKDRRVPCGDLQALVLRDAPPAPDPAAASVVLRDGHVLRGTLRGGGTRAIVLHSPLFRAVECPLQAIARIELPAAQAPPTLAQADTHDRLLFLNGDAVDGTVKAFAPEGIAFHSELLGDLDVGFDRIQAIAFAAQSGKAPATPKGVVAVVHALDGTRVAGQLRALAGGRIELDTLFGPELSLDLARILRIEFRGGRLVYLSDLAPATVKETPFFDLVWNYRRDQSVDGGPLRLGDRTYRKGLGVHSRCELTYALDGGYRRFVADVGIDEEVGEKGNVDVAVLVDGKVGFERKGVTGRDGPLPVAVDVQGASRITLVVDFGRELDICDHANWANARLIR